MPYSIPSVTHSAGDTGHATDHNSMAGILSQLTGIPPGGTVPVTEVIAPPAAQGDGMQRILIPSYFYPTTHVSDWNAIRAAAPYAAIAIVNPSSGPGGSSDPNWVTQVQQAQASGVLMLGYVHTSYAAVSLASIESQIDSYYSWYGVDGIFIDEVTQDAGAHQAYYASLYAYVKAKTSGQRLVVINPGAVPDQSYMSCCDICCDAEVSLSAYTSSWTPPSWGPNYPATRFLHIVYNVSTPASLAQTLALTRANRAGYVYIAESNAYTTLAGDTAGLGYWQQQVAWAANSQSAPAIPQPSGNLYQAWTCDPALTGGTTFTPVSGTLYLVGMQLPPMTIADIAFYTYGSGSGATASQNYVGIYNSAGTKVAASAATAADFVAANGFAAANVPLSAAYAFPGGFCWLALLLNASSMPAVIAEGAGDVTLSSTGLSTSSYRWCVNGTGLTALPYSITVGSNTLTGARNWWAAVK